jgi:hypothetical protein
MDSVLLGKAFKKFLLNSKIDIKFYDKLGNDDIKNILVEIINSDTNYFDGEYNDYKDFINYVKAFKNREEYDETIIPGNSKLLKYLQNSDNNLKVLNKSLIIYNLTIFLEDLGMNSCNGYLETRSWYRNNKSLQEKTIQVAIDCNADKINVLSDDYSEHIENLLNI